MSKKLLSLVAVVVLLSLVTPLWAQDSHDISLGGGLVARIRDKGTYPSLADRVKHIEQQLTDIISYKDTQKPVVNLKQVNGRWTVFAWDIAVMSVFPAEAKVNNLSEQQLGAIWARNLKERLPLATPTSKLPPEQLGYGKAPAAKPTVTTPAAKPAPAATAVAARPVPVTAPANPAPVAAPASGNESGALLLIVDALRTGRDLSEQEWVEQKENLARNLYVNLSYYLTGKGTPPPPTPARPLTPVAQPVAKPAAPAAPAAKPVAPVAQPVAKPAAPAAPAAKPVAQPAAPAAKPADPSMAKVPQKIRIRAKFAAAQEPFKKLQATDPEAAQTIADLLAASRQAFAWGKFDESEQQADAALQALGVTFKE
jgi:hypothetical protein